MKAFIHKVLKEIVESAEADERIIAQYFSPRYVQHVNGYVLDYKDFVKHMQEQKKVLESAKVTIERCVAEGDAICTVHVVDAVKKGGTRLSVKVIAFFKIEDGKIVLCDELTHLISGKEEDRDIGYIIKA